MNKKIIITGAALVIIAGGSFYGGMKYSSSHSGLSGSRSQAGAAGSFGGMRMGTRGAGGFTGGEIISTDDKSITVKMQTGGSKIIFLSDSTKIMKEASGRVTDLTVGTQVTVTGMTNTDGSVSAQTVQIRPAAMIPAKQ